ncbi:MAG: hypothetical protein ACW987_00630 [Candidatus Thorarchaeota archaeon]|jgi:hypothetical protein
MKNFFKVVVHAVFFASFAGGLVYVMTLITDRAEKNQIEAINRVLDAPHEEHQHWRYIADVVPREYPELTPDVKKAFADGVLTVRESNLITKKYRKIDAKRKELEEMGEKLKWIKFSESL